MYRIREVGNHDDDVADTLTDLHSPTFFDSASIPDFEDSYWWLAFHDGNPVGFAEVIPSTRVRNAGYFSRVGVLKRRCGHGLQLRFMRMMELPARSNGWNCVASDAADNLASANNFIRAGYRRYEPQYPWAWPHTLYWRKFVGHVGEAQSIDVK